MKDLITIGMPVYNVEKYVEKALLSALNQTYCNIEYILVDDKGPDNSMFIVRNILSTHPRAKDVRIIEHPENIGTGATRNTAIDSANGKYIFLMDSDDEISPDCIQKLYDKMIETNVDVVSGSYSHITGDKKIYFSWFHVPVWNKLYNLQFLRENNIRAIPNHLLEDVFFYVQVLATAKSYIIIPDITYYYYTIINIPPKEWSERIFIEWNQILIDSLNFLNNSTADIKTRIIIRKKLFWLVIGASGLALKSSHNVQHYINDYLKPDHLKNKDTLHNWILIPAYIFSCLPLKIKKILLRFYMKFISK